MEIHDYIRALRRSWLLLVLLAVFGGLVGAGVSSVTTPKYSADAKAYVSTQATASIGDLSQGAAYAQQVITTFSDIATTRLVLQQVKTHLDLDLTVQQLAKMVTVTPATGESVLDISVVDTKPARAAAIANDVANTLSTAVDDLSLRAKGTKAPIAIRLVNPAVAASAPDSPQPALYAGVGLAAGILLAFFVAVLREVLDTRVRTEEDSRRAVDLAVLGVVSGDRRNARRTVASLEGRDPRWSEPYRSLRNNLRFMDLGATKRSIVVSSALAGEGKTTSVVNLGLALADLGERVLLVDADLRRPQLAARLGLDGGVGLSDVLVGDVSLEAATQQWGDAHLAVLPSGQLPPNPNELLQSPAMAELLATVSDHYDTVLFDTPPVGAVSDAAVLGRATTGTLIVAAAGQVRRAQLARADAELEHAGVRVLGVVLTRVRKTASADYYGADSRTVKKRDRRAAATALLRRDAASSAS